MALPTALSSCNMCVEVMTGGTTFVDFSDEVSVVNPPTQPRASAEQHVFGEDPAALGFGKLGSTEITIRGVYTVATTSLFYKAYVAHTTACGALFAIGWSPGGCTTDNLRHRTSTTVAKITNLTYPAGDASSADVLMWEATVVTPDITVATWA